MTAWVRIAMLWSLGFAGALCGTSELARAQQDPFSMHAPVPLLGRWDVTVKTADGEYPSWFEVHQSGFRTLVGRYVGQFGSARPVSEFEFDGENVRFSVPPQWEHRTEPVVLEGRLEGDVIRGELTDDQGGTLSWTAVRAPKMERAGEVVLGEPIELFNGSDLAGWHAQFAGANNGWEAIDGVLTNARPGNNLITDRKFTDFELSLEFRYPEGSNSGIYLRGRHEVQIEDNVGLEADSHRIGGVYGFLTPSVNAALPAGEWQRITIRLVGRVVSVELNGERIIDRQVIPGITGGALDSHEGEPGPLMLQGDHGPVEYRAIVLREISMVTE